MITVRRSDERGFFDFGWLRTRHTFSFGDYRDPRFLGFRQLRVINEDQVAPGAGFPAHPHRDMEIVSYVVSGAIEHRDSMGNGSIIRPGEVQRMSAGTGVRHSEFNPSPSESLHFLQLWIVPDRPGHPPGYEQRPFPESERRGALRLVASPDGRDGSVSLHQDVQLYASLPRSGESLVHVLRPGRHAWVQVIAGELELLGERLAAGDGAAISGEERLEIQAPVTGEFLLFDLA